MTGADIAEAISHPTNQTLSISDDATVLSRAETYVARGFRDLKVRVGAGDFADDLRRLRLLRDRFGDDVKLAADANGGWSLEDAPRRLGDLEPFRLAYLEQPVAPRGFDDLARLAEDSPVPIMLDESVSDARSIADLCAGGHRLMAHLKLVKLGGLGPTIDAAHRLRDAGVPIMIGQMNEGGLATAAALHACAAVGPRFAELYGADGLENDPTQGLVYRDGTVAAPARPGLGLGFMADHTQTLWEDEI